MASNNQNSTYFDEIKQIMGLPYSMNLQNWISVKSLNFAIHGTPLTAFRAAIRQ